MTEDGLPDVDAMRREFDDSFTRPRLASAESGVELLCIRTGGQSCCLLMSELAGVHFGGPIVWVPSQVPALLGIVNLRGALAPVYDLGALLGRSTGVPPAGIAFIRFGAEAELLGFGFCGFDAHLRIPRRLLADIVVSPDGPRPVIHLGSLAETLNQPGPRTTTEEDHPR